MYISVEYCYLLNLVQWKRQKNGHNSVRKIKYYYECYYRQNTFRWLKLEVNTGKELVWHVRLSIQKKMKGA